MAQEQKQLLLKDLYARLPYGAFVQFEVDGQKTIKPLTVDFLSSTWYHTEWIKPYLRPMSSMTEEEIEEYWTKINNDAPEMPIDEISTIENIAKCSEVVLDFLNSHYLNYRGLITMGLALPATEGMYN